MATQNTAIAVYLPPEIEAKVKRYCQQNKLFLTRKGQTSERMGTGVVRLLESLLAHEESPPDLVRREEMEAAIAQAKAELLGLMASELQSLKAGEPKLPPMLQGSAGQ